MQLNRPYSKSLAAAACISFVALLCACILSVPEYRPLMQWLSDLGVGPAGWLFNAACVISGILLLGFYYSLLNKQLTLANSAGTAFGLASSFNLVLAGVFTEATPYHLMVSIAFFAFAAISSISLSISAGLTSRIASAALALSSIALALSLRPPVEWLTVALYGAWLLAYSHSNAFK